MAGVKPWTVSSLVACGLLLGACHQAAAPPAAKNEPAKVEAIEGTNLRRIRLTDKAAERLGIRTEPVRAAGQPGSGIERRVIPHAAVLYDPQGRTWTYTNPQPLVFVRQAIVVDFIDGDIAVLVDGPAPDAQVVTVGAPELFGAEFGVGH
jgi:hypothetical protein